MIDFKGCVGSEQVAVYLEDAGKCLMSMPMSGHTTRARISKLPFVVPGGLEAFSVGDGRLRLPQPRPETIDRMDEVLAWISLIPQDKVILRRIVGARALLSPVTGRNIYSWRRLGDLLDVDHKTIQRWRKDGLAIIARELNRQNKVGIAA